MHLGPGSCPLVLTVPRAPRTKTSVSYCFAERHRTAGSAAGDRLEHQPEAPSLSMSGVGCTHDNNITINAKKSVTNTQRPEEGNPKPQIDAHTLTPRGHPTHPFAPTPIPLPSPVALPGFDAPKSEGAQAPPRVRFNLYTRQAVSNSAFKLAGVGSVCLNLMNMDPAASRTARNSASTAAMAEEATASKDRIGSASGSTASMGVASTALLGSR